VGRSDLPRDDDDSSVDVDWTHGNDSISVRFKADDRGDNDDDEDKDEPKPRPEPEESPIESPSPSPTIECGNDCLR